MFKCSFLFHIFLNAFKHFSGGPFLQQAQMLTNGVQELKESHLVGFVDVLQDFKRV